VTRVGQEQADALCARFPELEHHALARLAILRQTPRVVRGRGVIAVVSAGTSDVPVAEEAALVAELFGNKVERVYDAGVAGLHRLLASLPSLRDAAVVIAVAGMEGALASVVGGLVAVPVIAVPTSVGYGASFGGVAALLAMLNSCAANVTVVNIDNGFGAAYVASLVNRA
jgi:NCAIR mutase (PurE)-related protein